MIGTLINVATVAAGSLLGMGLKHKLPERITRIVFQALGLFTLFIGVQMALQTANPLMLVLSLLIGSIIGEAASLEARIEALSRRLQGKQRNSTEGDRFTQGLVTAFMIFCVGSMTILGCLEEGLTGKRDLILTKSLMDFFSSTALAAAFGKGVLFSIIPLLVYQGGLTLAAGSLEGVLSTAMRLELVAVGGLMLIGLGLVILDLKKIAVINMLPALFIAPLLTYIAEAMDWYVM